MSLYRRGKKGIFYTDIEVHGRRVKRSTGTSSIREAKEFERQLRRQLEDQHKQTGGQPVETLDEAIDIYMRIIIAPKTSRPNIKKTLYYLGLLRNLIGGNKRIDKITPGDIAHLQGELLKDRKPNTVNRYLTVLKAVLNYAHKRGALPKMPLFSPIRINDQRVRYLTEEEESRLLTAAPVWLQDLIIFYVETGARKSEALNLTWDDVQLERKPRGLVIFRVTKNQQTRSVPLSRRCIDMLKRLNSNRPNDTDQVFLYAQGKSAKRVPIGNFKKSWATAKKTAGIEDLKVHDLRHTFASRLAMKGVPLLDVGKLLGHNSYQMTMRYAHLAPDALDGAIAALDD